MPLDEIRALYDRDQRREPEYPGMVRDVVGTVVRYAPTFDLHGFILYSALDEATADAAIREQIAFFAARRQAFEWKLYSYDQPVDLRERLAAHGFQVGEVEATLVLDVATTLPTPEAESRITIHRITDPTRLAEVMAVQEEVFGPSGHEEMVTQLRHELTEAPDALSVYAARADARWISAAWVRFTRRNAFASLWGGATLPTYRRRGVYRALVAARLEEARARGYRFLTVDASPMSRPILERLGFRWIADSYPCLWVPKGKIED